MEKLKKQSEALGPDKIRAVEDEWPELIAKVRGKMEGGARPDDPEVLKLAARWKGHLNVFSGGDGEIIRAAERFHAENPDNALRFGMDGDLYRYIGQAMAHL